MMMMMRRSAQCTRHKFFHNMLGLMMESFSIHSSLRRSAKVRQETAVENGGRIGNIVVVSGGRRCLEPLTAQ